MDWVHCHQYSIFFFFYWDDTVINLSVLQTRRVTFQYLRHSHLTSHTFPLFFSHSAPRNKLEMRHNPLLNRDFHGLQIGNRNRTSTNQFTVKEKKKVRLIGFLFKLLHMRWVCLANFKMAFTGVKKTFYNTDPHRGWVLLGDGGFANEDYCLNRRKAAKLSVIAITLI